MKLFLKVLNCLSTRWRHSRRFTTGSARFWTTWRLEEKLRMRHGCDIMAGLQAFAGRAGHEPLEEKVHVMVLPLLL